MTEPFAYKTFIPTDGTIVGRSGEYEEPYVLIQFLGRPVRFFMENENGPAPCEASPNPQG